MRRRRFIIALGGIAGTGSLIGGSGAFNYTNVRRKVLIASVGDAASFLSMKPLSDSGINRKETGRSYSLRDGRVAFSIPGGYKGENAGAEGVGKDSIYEFSDLLKISNQGSHQVKVQSEHDGKTFTDIALVRNGELLRNNPPSIEVGGSISVGLYIDSHGSEIGKYHETLKIIGESIKE